MPIFSSYYLAKWSAYVRDRDGMECYMCKRKCLKLREVKELVMIARIDYLDQPVESTLTIDTLNGLLGEAHHCKPKGNPAYSHLAYDPDNGITLCRRCHRDVVHSTWHTFKIYLHPFSCYMRRNIVKTFNDKYQSKIKPK